MDPKNNQLTDVSSTNIDGNFFSVAMTTPFAAARIKYQICKYEKQKLQAINLYYKKQVIHKTLS